MKTGATDRYQNALLTWVSTGAPATETTRLLKYTNHSSLRIRSLEQRNAQRLGSFPFSGSVFCPESSTIRRRRTIDFVSFHPTTRLTFRNIGEISILDSGTTHTRHRESLERRRSFETPIWRLRTSIHKHTSARTCPRIDNHGLRNALAFTWACPEGGKGSPFFHHVCVVPNRSVLFSLHPVCSPQD